MEYCIECGEEKDIAYIDNYAGEEHYKCKKCGNEFSIVEGSK